MKTIVTKGVKLSQSEHAVLTRLAKGEKLNRAVKAVYRSPNDRQANQTASRLMKRERFMQVLERAGLTDDALASKFVKLLEHKKPLVVDKRVEMYDDGNVQLATAKVVSQIRGYLDNNADQSTVNGDPLIIKNVKFEDNRMVINNTSEQEK